MSDLNELYKLNKKRIDSVGPRYNQEVNIETEYSFYFEPLLRSKKYKDEILKRTGKLQHKFDDVYETISSEE